ncbi:serine/threonine-protein kinase, partial [Rhodococcus aerolatus]
MSGTGEVTPRPRTHGAHRAPTVPLDPSSDAPGPGDGAPDVVASRYRVRGRLGGGGMGTVWLAQDEVLRRTVALKQVRTVPGASAADRAEQRDHAMHEGRTAARLATRHAVTVFDVVLHDDDPWLVLEHLPSRDLAEVVEADQVLPVAQTAQVGAQVADALADAHAAGIVHRDVKPDNVLVGEGGPGDAVVKLADFGIALAPGDDAAVLPGFVAGTPAYLAPEVARGGPSTAASDVYALGATLFACLEGVPPHGPGGDALEVVARAAAGPTLPPTRAGALEPVLLRMLAADPADRPTAAQARDELAAVAAGRRGAVGEVLAARTRLTPVARAAA